MALAAPTAGGTTTSYPERWGSMSNSGEVILASASISAQIRV